MRPMRAGEPVVELVGEGVWVRSFASLGCMGSVWVPVYEPRVHSTSTILEILSLVAAIKMRSPAARTRHTTAAQEERRHACHQHSCSQREQSVRLHEGPPRCRAGA